MLGYAGDQKNERSDHSEGDDAGGDEGKDAGDIVMAAVIRIDKRNQQNHGDNEQAPAWANGEALRHRAVDESRGKHGDEGGPARLAKNFYGLGGHAIRLVPAGLIARNARALRRPSRAFVSYQF